MPLQAIVPDFIPADTAPLAEGDVPDVSPVTAEYVKTFHGRNVYVEMFDGSYAVGRLEIGTHSYSVGSTVFTSYPSIKSFREV